MRPTLYHSLAEDIGVTMAGFSCDSPKSNCKYEEEDGLLAVSVAEELTGYLWDQAKTLIGFTEQKGCTDGTNKSAPGLSQACELGLEDQGRFFQAKEWVGEGKD